MATWVAGDEPSREISFMPARVLLQDFTGVPAVVDLAAMRDAMAQLGGDPALISSNGGINLYIGTDPADRLVEITAHDIALHRPSRSATLALTTAVVAYVVDYHVVPRRLSPGFDSRMRLRHLQRGAHVILVAGGHAQPGVIVRVDRVVVT